MSTKRSIAMTAKNKNEMTEAELKAELKGSMLILSTSSPDKRDIYRELFSSHAKDADHHAGLDLYYTDSGALGIAPRKTPEQTGDYHGNLKEKAILQLEGLRDETVQQSIRSRLASSARNEFDPETVKIIGMTEDSGWSIAFDNKVTQAKFIDAMQNELRPILRERDLWLIEKMEETGFPGPNLKPVQEHLTGGFHALMEMIYDVAQRLNILTLRYTNVISVSFVSPHLRKHYTMVVKSSGRILTREEYEERLLSTQRGEAINSNFVHVPDGQIKGTEETVDELIRAGLHSKSSATLPAEYARRDLTESLQQLIGKRRSSRAERKRPVRIAFVDPQTMHGHSIEDVGMPHLNDFQFTSVPTLDDLHAQPNVKIFGDADVIALAPEKMGGQDNHLRADPNLGLLLNFVVTAETDPESMSIPLVLDNRFGGFDKSLELISDAFAQGRLMGEPPFRVASTDDELKEVLAQIKDIKQRAPIISTPRRPHDERVQPLPAHVPADGTFTLFIGGGHANNSKRDLTDAKDFGYHSAQHGWRIVTGAGSVEGSMGGVHTGFVQYHLDQLQQAPGNDEVKQYLQKYNNRQDQFDAENLILAEPSYVEELAEKGHIPREMFYGYSMKPLLEMESPSGAQPPAITYFDSGNRVRRLSGLLAPGTKVLLPGSVGTDEECEESIRQHLQGRAGERMAHSFTDGTPKNQGQLIIYNRKGHLDKLLQHYGLAGDDPVATTKRKHNNITIVTSLNQLKKVSVRVAEQFSKITS